jgi:hypothetical protein
MAPALLKPVAGVIRAEAGSESAVNAPAPTPTPAGAEGFRRARGAGGGTSDEDEDEDAEEEVDAARDAPPAPAAPDGTGGSGAAPPADVVDTRRGVPAATLPAAAAAAVDTVGLRRDASEEPCATEAGTGAEDCVVVIGGRVRPAPGIDDDGLGSGRPRPLSGLVNAVGLRGPLKEPVLELMGRLCAPAAASRSLM